jgi:hypothetical protein
MSDVVDRNSSERSAASNPDGVVPVFLAAVRQQPNAIDRFG